MYRNIDGTSFVDDGLVTVPITGYTRGATAGDFDADGYLDAYLDAYLGGYWNGSDQYIPDHIVMSHGGTSYTTTEVSGSNGHSIGSAWGDIDNDGHLDLFVGNFSHAGQPQSQWLRNWGPDVRSDTQFTFDNKGTGGVVWQESFASPSLGDYDNDGDLDLFFTTVYGGDSSVLYRNDGNWNFSNVTSSEGLPGFTSTYQNAWGDYDNDGDLDLISGGRLFRNNLDNNNN